MTTATTTAASHSGGRAADTTITPSISADRAMPISTPGMGTPATPRAQSKKPASTAPVVAAKFVEIMEECMLPPGVLNFCPGSGGEIGDTLVERSTPGFPVIPGVLLGIPGGYFAAQGLAAQSNTIIEDFGVSVTGIVIGVLVGLLEGCAIAHPVRVEHDDVGVVARRQAATLVQLQVGCGKGGQAAHGFLERNDPLVAREFAQHARERSGGPGMSTLVQKHALGGHRGGSGRGGRRRRRACRRGHRASACGGGRSPSAAGEARRPANRGGPGSRTVPAIPLQRKNEWSGALRACCASD